MSAPALTTTARYCCGDERRREVVRAAGTLNGIDYLEVDPSQLALTVVLLQPVEGPGAVPPGPAPTVDQIRLEPSPGGIPVQVVSVTAAGDTLTVGLDRVGDQSAYTLRLAEPTAAADVPEGYDTRLASVTFSMKAACPSLSDCAPEPASCPPGSYPEPALDYLAKDYDSLRGLMLDRLATTLPGWTERHPADAQIALVELLAYVADRLSYAQDAIALEAHLGTARLRTSVRRHARLLDYPMSDGVSARTFLHFTATTGLTVPRGTAARVGARASAPVFETLADVTVRAAHDELAIYTWSDEACSLPRGATRATLVAGPGTDLQPGDLLLLEEILGAGGSAPDPTHRAVVRLVQAQVTTDRLDGTPVVEVAWDDRDALAFPLVVSVPGAVTAVARGNIALADHGSTQPDAPLVEEVAPLPGRWRPLVPEGPLARSAPYDAAVPASGLLPPDPSAVRPAIVLHAGDEEWVPERDLLDAGPAAPVFVVELEEDGSSRLRFGDDELGRSPAAARAQTGFVATYRVGSGGLGNVGPDTVDTLLAPLAGVTAVRNVVAGVGGADPEPLERVRLLAPEAFRVQQRAVTVDDYAAVAAGVRGVQRAAATMRWTGSWYAADVTVDTLVADGTGCTDGCSSTAGTGGTSRTDGTGVDGPVAAAVAEALELARMTGVDVEVVAPVAVPLDLALTVRVAAGAVAADVWQRVGQRLSAGRLPDGRRAAFHPDELTLGQPVYLSRVYAAVLEVAGVTSTTATRFRRLGRPDGGELAAGVLRVSRLEVARLDVNRTGAGVLDLTVVGGL